ncbi:hypothetical protein [Desertibacillus haloalkaliphilus]|uniref:hypothetical protein n=1 Tax=Desertibacillus haloalkaliphilus TaxID=1328930 RepID=UPI001C25A872|nr:hypothetical protein [Desertibacillus haloalkaliphilus]MBU8906036.1 hypothetical protein [Desertibacillus haloalkaliphilus]
MYKKELEIRGISRQSIIEYLVQLGGELETKDRISCEHWTCEVSAETFVELFRSEVPVVHVLFSAESKDGLADIVRGFRLKTFRAGG